VISRSAEGSVASFGAEREVAKKASFPGNSRGHFEEFVDESIVMPDAPPTQPPHLALPNYVDRLIALNRSSRSLEFAKPCLACTRRLIARWSCSMMLFRYWTGRWAPAAESPFLLYLCDGRAVDRRQICVLMTRVEGAIDHSTPCETAVWRHRRRAMRTIGNR
jgi:hypothetical protein